MALQIENITAVKGNPSYKHVVAHDIKLNSRHQNTTEEDQVPLLYMKMEPFIPIDFVPIHLSLQDTQVIEPNMECTHVNSLRMKMPSLLASRSDRPPLSHI